MKVPKRSGFSPSALPSSYLRSVLTMHTVSTLNHNDVFIGSRSFQMLTSKNGLVAAKLAKIRKAMTEESKTSGEGWDAVAVAYAKMGDDGKPVQKTVQPETPKPAEGQKPEDVKAPDPVPQFYNLSGTKVYDLADPEKENELTDALEAFCKGNVELTVPELTENDMGWVICAGPNGQEFPIPGMVSDVFHHFAPAM